MLILFQAQRALVTRENGMSINDHFCIAKKDDAVTRLEYFPNDKNYTNK